jgi:hypothetical protein
MKSKSLPDQIATGVDQRHKAETQMASDIKNMRVEDQGLGFVNDRGWEPVVMHRDDETITLPVNFTLQRAPCRFLNIWTRHGSSEVYYLNERQGELAYTFGNGGGGTRRVVLESGRNIPKSDDPGTQMTSFGRWSLILNGYDRPQKFWGREYMTPFGWLQRPGVPSAHRPNPEYADKPYDTKTGDIGFVLSDVKAKKLIGLGNSGNGTESVYKYKISFISDTGSESPLSEPVGEEWAIDDSTKEGYWSVMLSDIPTGPKGTKARRIYRTKNISEGQPQKYYYVKQINDNVTTDWIDILPDSFLLTDAPDGNASIVLPGSFKHGESFNGCIWIGGGEDLDTTIRYSERYLPEQFNRFRFFELGSRNGGGITALVSYYNMLIVFRENSIEAISAIAEDEYTISTISNDIGTRAANTIVDVPTVGLFFLTPDGVYVLQGGQSGAGQVTLEALKVSGGLHKEWDRLSEGSLSRATATYSKREKEYWVHYPVDGDTENSRGAVFHTQTNSWTLRNLSEPDHLVDGNKVQMNFTQLATDPEGWIIMGTYPDYPYVNTIDSNFTGYPGFGLQVWSASNSFGSYLSFTGLDGQGDNVYDVIQSPKGTGGCRYASVNDDLGDDSIKKRIISLEIEMITQGYNDLTLSYISDGGFTETVAGVSAPMIVEQYKTTGSEPVWTVSSGSTDVKNLAAWNLNKWSGPQLCRVRWDVHTGLVGAFKWILTSGNKFHIISHQIEYMDSKQKIITHGGSNG